MPSPAFIQEVGRQVVKGTTTENTNAATPISLAAATSIVLPAIMRVNQVAGQGVRKKILGHLECTIVLEGTAACRYTITGVTPTAAIGHLTPAPTATAPVTMIIRGFDVITSFLIIQTAVSASFTYYFACGDLA